MHLYPSVYLYFYAIFLLTQYQSTRTFDTIYGYFQFQLFTYSLYSLVHNATLIEETVN